MTALASSEVVDARSAREIRRLRFSPFSATAALVTTAVAALICYPMVRALGLAFIDDGSPSIGAFQRVLQDPLARRAIGNTLLIVAVSTLAAVTIACVFAWINERTDAGMGWLGRLMPILPLLVPPLATSIGSMFLFAPRAGVVNVWSRRLLGHIGFHLETGPFDIFTMRGVIFVYTIFLVPFAYLPIANALANVDPAFEEASRNAGAGLMRTLRRVTLPAVRPAIVSGATLAAIVGIALFAAPVILGTPANVEVASVRVYRMLTFEYPPRDSEAVALALLMFGAVAVGLLLQNRFVRGSEFATVSGRARSGGRTPVGRWRWPLRALVLGYVALTTVVPFFGLLLISIQAFWGQRLTIFDGSFDAYRDVFFENDTTRAALKNSMLLGAVGATIAVAVLAIVGLFVHRNNNHAGRAAAAVTKAPAALPHLVLAVAFLVSFGPAPFQLRGTLALLLLAYFLLYLPQGSFLVNASFRQIGKDLVEASASAGAKPGRTFRRIELPLIIPSLVATWTLLFVLMAGDVTASAMLTTQHTPVVGSAILSSYEFGSFPRIAALGVIVSVATVTVVGLAQVFGRRREAS